jgi:RND family efflux transporter MFP subunit
VDTQVAPVAGIVSDMLVAKGDRISADTVVLHLTAETGMIASLGIDPEDLDKLTVGMPVTIQPVFGATSESAATVIQIHAMINPASNLVELLAEIPAADLQHFVLGSRLTGTFHFAPHTAFVVPRSAVLTADGEAFVYTIANGTATRVVVETGIEAGEELEVRGDLQPGQRVAVIGNYVLEDGMAVRENP